jgi:hypothetical protein
MFGLAIFYGIFEVDVLTERGQMNFRVEASLSLFHKSNHQTAMNNKSVVSSSPATQTAGQEDSGSTIAEHSGEPNESSCRYYIVQTDFVATYEWQGEAESEEQASEKAYAAVANLSASELWSEMYGCGQEIELVEVAVANILK